MTDVIGWELDRALARLRAEGVPSPEVERALPPRGEPYPDGVWRVVRADVSRGRLTAALFPRADSPRGEGEGSVLCPDCASPDAR